MRWREQEADEPFSELSAGVPRYVRNEAGRSVIQRGGRSVLPDQAHATAPSIARGAGTWVVPPEPSLRCHSASAALGVLSGLPFCLGVGFPSPWPGSV
jgi:hypothetical protein